MAIQAGKLRHRVFLLKPTRTQNSLSGQYSDTWVSQGRVWASVNPVSAKERFEAGSAVPEVTHKVRIRHRSNVNSAWRVMQDAESSALASNLTAGAVSATLSSATEIGQSTDYYARIESEIVLVSSGQGTTTLTIARGKFGTAAAEHLSGTRVFYLKPFDIEGVLNYQEKDETLDLLCNENGGAF